MIDFQTKNCIVCGEPAISYTGHVHLYIDNHDIKVMSGLCEEHDNTNGNGKGKNRCKGCDGNWMPSYGLTLIYLDTGEVVTNVTN